MCFSISQKISVVSSKTRLTELAPFLLTLKRRYWLMACPKLVGSLFVPRIVHSGDVKTAMLLFKVVRIMARDIIFERMLVE